MKGVRKRAWLALMALAMAVGGGRAMAATTANEVLTVTFNASLDVQIDGVQFSTYALGSQAASVTAVPASTATVTNASAGLTEQWSLSVSTVAGGGNWSVTNSTGNGNGGHTACSTSCPGLDTYAFQAMFVSSNTTSVCGNGDARWTTVVSTVGASGLTYNSARYASQTLVSGATGNPDYGSGSGHDGNMLPYVAGSGVGKRGLCTRLIMPSSVTSGAAQTLQLTITASGGI